MKQNPLNMMPNNEWEWINIPRQSRGFFICGHSPRILARASRRASTVCQPRKFRYLPPVNGHFRSLAWSAALLLCPARTDIGYTPVSSLHFSLPCPHSTHGTRIPGSGIYIFAPGTSRTASGCFFLSPTPWNLLLLSLAVSRSACGCGPRIPPLR